MYIGTGEHGYIGYRYDMVIDNECKATGQHSRAYGTKHGAMGMACFLYGILYDEHDQPCYKPDFIYLGQ